MHKYKRHVWLRQVAKGCIAVSAAKGCRMRVENVCGPAPAGGTRRHHEAAAQLSGTEAQHPSQPASAEVTSHSANHLLRHYGPQ